MLGHVFSVCLLNIVSTVGVAHAWAIWCDVAQVFKDFIGDQRVIFCPGDK